MLKKERRIGRELLKKLVKPTVFANSTLISARIYSIKGEKSKFSFSVSKKVEKSAVLRNKMRRAGYEAIREKLPLIKEGFAFRFTFNKKPQNNKQDIIEAVNKIFQQNDLLL